ncbi:MAG: hypothetical protein O3A00_22830 [Planctomycetota bacterium]|nr:hypothetical protein [Planctomycetota bacterium]
MGVLFEVTSILAKRGGFAVTNSPFPINGNEFNKHASAKRLVGIAKKTANRWTLVFDRPNSIKCSANQIHFRRSVQQITSRRSQDGLLKFTPNLEGNPFQTISETITAVAKNVILWKTEVRTNGLPIQGERRQQAAFNCVRARGERY